MASTSLNNPSGEPASSSFDGLNTAREPGEFSRANIEFLTDGYMTRAREILPLLAELKELCRPLGSLFESHSNVFYEAANKIASGTISGMNWDLSNKYGEFLEAFKKLEDQVDRQLALKLLPIVSRLTHKPDWLPSLIDDGALRFQELVAEMAGGKFVSSDHDLCLKVLDFVNEVASLSSGIPPIPAEIELVEMRRRLTTICRICSDVMSDLCSLHI